MEPLSAAGLGALRAGREAAVRQALERFYAVHGAAYERFGERGREACREDLAFHLEFMEPALELGRPETFVRYLAWLRSVLAARGVPAEHLQLSVRLLADALVPRLDPSDAAKLEALVAAAAAAQDAPDVFQQVGQPIEPAARDMTEALLRGDRRAALGLLEGSADDARAYCQAEVRLVQSAMYEIGARWQRNVVSVGQEHLATATAQTVITQALVQREPVTPRPKRVLLACVEGNHHALGLRMVADAFELAGWSVSYLGANTPTRTLCETAAALRPELVGLSAALPQHLRAARAAIAGLRAVRGDAGRPRILLGGLAVNLLPGIDRVLGADGTVEHAAACFDYAGKDEAA